MYVEKLKSIVILFVHVHVVGCKHLQEKKSLLRHFAQYFFHICDPVCNENEKVVFFISTDNKKKITRRTF